LRFALTSRHIIPEKMNNEVERAYAEKAGTLPPGSERYDYDGHISTPHMTTPNPILHPLEAHSQTYNSGGHASQTTSSRQYTHPFMEQSEDYHSSAHSTILSAQNQNINYLAAAEYENFNRGDYAYLTTAATRSTRSSASQFEQYNGFATPRPAAPTQYSPHFAAQYEFHNRAAHATSGITPSTLPRPTLPPQSFAPTSNSNALADVHDLFAARLRAGEIQPAQAQAEYIRMTTHIFHMSYE
jgi:hypothetical protein